MNIFCYWILKSEFTPQRVEELEREKRRSNGGDLDSIIIGDEEEEDSAGAAALALSPNALNPGDYCDCVYLVSQYTEEIELVCSSYLALVRDRTPPLLPGDLPDEEESEEEDHATHQQRGGDKKPPPTPAPAPAPHTTATATATPRSQIKEASKKAPATTKRSSMFNKLFMSAGANDDDEEEEEEEEEYNMGGIMDLDFEDIAQSYDQQGLTSQQNVAFQDELFPPLSSCNIDILNGGTGEAQMAATMEELNELTFKDFLEDDEEDDEEGEEEEDSDNSSASGERLEVEMDSSKGGKDKPAPIARRNSLFKWS
jgi:hypothetical protein